MASFYRHKCNHCGYEFQTSGPHEFYRDREGKIKPYGHPVPISKEAEEIGVCGFLGDVYCPNCDQVYKDIILAEFTQSVKNSLKLWAGDWAPKDPKPASCPRCGNTNLILEPVKGMKCPRCKKGYIEGFLELIT